MEGAVAARRIRLRYPASCASCGAALPKGTEAVWDPGTKKARCLSCASGDLSSRDVAGASALATGARRRQRAIEKARSRWGGEAAAVAARVVADDPSIRAWEKGAGGESRLAAFVDREVGNGVIALHDRLVPGTRAANIDHIFVAPAGVWVVDAKTYAGKLERRDVGPFWRQENQILVNGRDRTKLAHGLHIQLRAVRAALEPDPAYDRIPVRAVLCFVDTEWGLFARPFDVDGVTVMYPGALRSGLRKDGPLARPEMVRIADRLHRSLPSASYGGDRNASSQHESA